MKTITRAVLLLLLTFSLAFGATIPPLEVTVTNAAGKVAYKGKISARGTFETGPLEPGNYVVEFDSKAKIANGSKFALNATAGKNNVSSDSVAGEKFVDPGIAMKISVASSSKITGQVAPAGSLSKQTQTAATGKAKSKYTGPVKVINGKRYIWVTPYTGSVGGGHWAEEGSEDANQAEGITGMHGNQPAAPRSGGMRY